LRPLRDGRRREARGGREWIKRGESAATDVPKEEPLPESLAIDESRLLVQLAMLAACDEKRKVETLLPLVLLARFSALARGYVLSLAMFRDIHGFLR